MIAGLRYLRLEDPQTGEELLLCYPPPSRKDKWGVLAPLKGTTWGDQIPTVSGENLSFALHGRHRPLRETLGRPPRGRVLRIAMEERECFEKQEGTCGLAGPNCYPGSGLLPECYVPPTPDPDLRACATAVAAAWDEGRYVVLVEGDEFVVT